MTRLGRILAAVLVLVAALFLIPLHALADCTDPLDPDFGNCPSPPGGQATPKPTPKPTPAATPAPATPAPTRRPVQPAPVFRSTPEPTPFDVEVETTAEPDETPQIVVTGPVDSGRLDTTQPSASASSWIFGFIVGFIIGGLAGRASWGLRKRRRQQIFG